MPDRPDAAGVPRITSVGVYRVGLTVDLERLVLGSGHDITNRNSSRILGQVIAAFGAPDALYQPGATKPEQNLLDIVCRESLGVGQLACGDGANPSTPPLGEMNRDDQAVFGPRSEEHTSELQSHV